MRISKKHEDVARKNLTLNNMEQQSTNTFETFFHDKLGPDFYENRQWVECIVKKQ